MNARDLGYVKRLVNKQPAIPPTQHVLGAMLFVPHLEKLNEREPDLEGGDGRTRYGSAEASRIRRCRAASYRTIEAAVAAFNELAAPAIGIPTM